MQTLKEDEIGVLFSFLDMNHIMGIAFVSKRMNHYSVKHTSKKYLSLRKGFEIWSRLYEDRNRISTYIQLMAKYYIVSYDKVVRANSILVWEVRGFYIKCSNEPKNTQTNK